MRVLVINEQTILDESSTVPTLMIFRAQLNSIKAGYTDLALDVPEWVDEKLMSLDREIKTRVQGELQRRLRAAELQRNNLRTRDEKRADLDREIETLKAKLG